MDERTSLRLIQGDYWSLSKKLIGQYLAAVGIHEDLLAPAALIYILSIVFGPFLVREGERKEHWYRKVVKPNLRSVGDLLG